METKGSFSFGVRVNLNGLREHKGYSDLVPTYCCSATPCYYVVFPETGYEGYFQKWDVEVNGKG